MPSYKYILTFKRNNGSAIAQVRSMAANQMAAFEMIRDRLGLGWFLTKMETV